MCPAVLCSHSTVAPICCAAALHQDKKIIERFAARDDRLVYRSATYIQDEDGAEDEDALEE